MKVSTYAVAAVLILSIFGATLHIEEAKSPLMDDGNPVESVDMAALMGNCTGFVENKGQIEDISIEYYLTFQNLEIHFYSSMVEYVLLDATSAELAGEAVTIRFPMSYEVKPQGRWSRNTTLNFYVGNDDKQWIEGIGTFDEVVYSGLYEGVDLVYRLTDTGCKYEFRIGLEGDPDEISLSVRGHEKLSTTRAGEMVISTVDGIMRDTGLVAFYDGSPSDVVDCAFDIQDDDTYGFILGDYDRGRPIVIDPLIFSSFIGGGGWDGCMDVALDGEGYMYLAGWTSSPGMFTSTGALKANKTGWMDIYLAKMNPAGSRLVYATYLGGTNDDTIPYIKVEPSGRVYITGLTQSEDFPTTPDAYQREYRGSKDAFVAKVDENAGALLYSTYLGGSGMDWANGIDVDEDGHAYVTGETGSDDFPVSDGAYGRNHSGYSDVFVTKLSPDGSSMVYSTFISGNDFDVPYGIGIDREGNCWVAGTTQSTDFPVTEDAFQTIHSGGPNWMYSDAFVCRVGFDGTNLLYSTYIGSNGTDTIRDLTVDDDGNAYVTGESSSTFPTTEGAYKRGGGVFAVKFLASDNSIAYSTTIGGGSSEGIALDASGNVYLCGSTGSASWPITEGAVQDDPYDLFDGMVARLNTNGSQLVYSTVIGSHGTDRCRDIAVDGSGNAIVCGQTGAGDFPITEGSYQSSYGGDINDGFVFKLETDKVDPIADAGEDRTVGQGKVLVLNGSNSTDNAEIVNWSWSVAIGAEEQIVYGKTASISFLGIGVYEIILNVTDLKGNWAVDSVNVTVIDSTAPTAYAGPDQEGDQMTVVFFDGTGSSDNVAILEWTWSFTYGDEERELSGPSPSFTFDLAGEYVVVLNVTDTSGFWSTDSMCLTVRDIERPESIIESDEEVNQHDTVLLDGEGSRDNVGVVNWTWTFVYGEEKVVLWGPVVSYTCDIAGTYDISLRVADEQGNWHVNTTTLFVKDTESPVADAGKDRPVTAGQMVKLDGSKSIDNVLIVNFTWTFIEDGRTIHLYGQNVKHEFKNAGKVEIELVVTDGEGNSDKDMVILDVEEAGSAIVMVVSLLIIVAIVSIITLIAFKRRRVDR